MNKKSKYLFSFFLILSTVLCFEVLYLKTTYEYTHDELLKKESLQRIATLSNLDSAIKENRIEIYR